MLILVLSLAMVAGLCSATAVALHNEAENSRVKAVVRKRRPLH
ncbi:hypothetical protein GCM10011390_04430 [Aureimonas endophytica]|uniref:Uncharacterized protein n=1 Tax=Aureimonas endophytica TaxID=2027858 RepID=A0A917E0Q3_9HYPH|nr:hypothetical protein [Aureimonas endophytica]GGD88783.1 hypothetical protein GCM10011390_04430 [Aureimonas endophytica]